jgi:glycosyltransferase involved in cell wall biosynthesis
MKVSLIMATVGRCDEIHRLLNSLDRQTSSDFELIVVDQNVEGFLDPIIQRLSCSTVAFKHIKTDKRGLSIARNLGFLHAEHGIIGYPDDDCWYEEDVIARMLASFKTDSSLDGLIARWVEWDKDLTEHTLKN